MYDMVGGRYQASIYTFLPPEQTDNSRLFGFGFRAQVIKLIEGTIWYHGHRTPLWRPKLYIFYFICFLILFEISRAFYRGDFGLNWAGDLAGRRKVSELPGRDFEDEKKGINKTKKEDWGEVARPLLVWPLQLLALLASVQSPQTSW
jgi:hypothetical protein